MPWKQLMRFVVQPSGHDDQAQGIRLVDGAGISPLGVGGPPAVLDPNRAFQAISVATLEAAAADMHYPVPSEQVQPSLGFPMLPQQAPQAFVQGEGMPVLPYHHHITCIGSYTAMRGL